MLGRVLFSDPHNKICFPKAIYSRKCKEDFYSGNLQKTSSLEHSTLRTAQDFQHWWQITLGGPGEVNLTLSLAVSQGKPFWLNLSSCSQVSGDETLLSNKRKPVPAHPSDAQYVPQVLQLSSSAPCPTHQVSESQSASKSAKLIFSELGQKETDLLWKWQ